MSTRVAVSAHRGGNEEHPAGTWEAYRAAVTGGADYVEFDVRRLADGQLVCHHDATTRSTQRELRTLTYPQLCAEAGHEVPTVAGVLAEIAGEAAAHVDLKEVGYEAEVVRLALDTLGPDGFVVTSLEDASVAAVTRQFPQVRTALSLGRDRAEIRAAALPGTRWGELFPLRRVRACGAHWVAAHYSLVQYGLLRRCARHRIGAMIWTVDDVPMTGRLLADPRVEVLVTNRPQQALALRARLGGYPRGG